MHFSVLNHRNVNKIAFLYNLNSIQGKKEAKRQIDVEQQASVLLTIFVRYTVTIIRIMCYRGLILRRAIGCVLCALFPQQIILFKRYQANCEKSAKNVNDVRKNNNIGRHTMITKTRITRKKHLFFYCVCAYWLFYDACLVPLLFYLTISFCSLSMKINNPLEQAKCFSYVNTHK